MPKLIKLPGRYLIFIIFGMSLFINFYRISEVPPSLSWDEAAVGYDAWAISKDGKDQWGESFPVAFRSFEEYKYPLHIYTTALFVKIFGLSEAIVRIPAALLGAINVLILYFLVFLIAGNRVISVLSSLFLTISPWFINFSRVNWETNFALFFFLSGLLLFFYGLKKNISLMIPAAILLGLDLYTYNAAKVFIPIFFLFLVIIYRKELLSHKMIFKVATVVFLGFLSFNILNSNLSGLKRFQQVSFSEQQIRETTLYKVTNKYLFGKVEVVLKQYLSHFSPQFLFISGDNNPRHSSQLVGQLYWSDLLLLPLGLMFLIKSKKKYSYLFLTWFFLAPLPASITKEAPHASRSMFALGGWQIVSAAGVYYLCIIRNRFLKICLFITLAAVITLSFFYYMFTYFSYYPIKYSQDWQYGYKEIYKRYGSQFDKFNNIVISDNFSQPYIFALFYLHYDPAKFRSEVKYNTSKRRKTSLVSAFGKYSFDDIKFANLKKGNNLIFASPADELKELPRKDVILNLDNSVAFFVYEYSK